MARINQLKTRRTAIRQRITDLRTLLGTEDRSMTKDEGVIFATAETELEGVNAEIVQEERFIEADRAVAAANPPGTAPADPDQAAARAGQASVGIHVRDRVEDDPMRGFVDMADFACAVRMVNMPSSAAFLDPRLKVMWSGAGGPPIGAEAVANAAMAGMGPNRLRADAPPSQMQEAHTTEGYEVPPQIRTQIFELLFMEGTLLDAVSPEPTSSNSVEIVADETTPWGATGVQARWRSEATKMTPSELETKMEIVKLHELYAFVLATEELLADAPRLNDRLLRKAAQAIRWRASESLVTGTGAGQPLGWLSPNYAGAITVNKEGSQPADTIVPANVLKMLSVLLTDGADLAQIFWLANRDTLPQIAVMTIGDQPVWTPPNQGLKGSPTGALLGHPIIFSEHAETIGDKGDLQLINAAGYFSAVKGGPANGLQFATSIHLFFDYNIMAFRWIFRLAGQPFLSTPMVPEKGQNKAHMVFLEERT